MFSNVFFIGGKCARCIRKKMSKGIGIAANACALKYLPGGGN